MAVLTTNGRGVEGWYGCTGIGAGVDVLVTYLGVGGGGGRYVFFSTLPGVTGGGGTLLGLSFSIVIAGTFGCTIVVIFWDGGTGTGT